MLKFAAREPVIRHRGGGRDEDGKLVAGSDAELLAFGVAPGGGTDTAERGRSGETIDCTVYFPAGTDIVNSDELTVRGKRFRIVVNDWRITGSPVGGLEALCMRGEG